MVSCISDIFTKLILNYLYLCNPLPSLTSVYPPSSTASCTLRTSSSSVHMSLMWTPKSLPPSPTFAYVSLDVDPKIPSYLSLSMLHTLSHPHLPLFMHPRPSPTSVHMSLDVDSEIPSGPEVLATDLADGFLVTLGVLHQGVSL